MKSTKALSQTSPGPSDWSLASEQWFRAIFDAVGDAIFVHDATTGQIVDANQRACALYGLSLEQMRAQGPDILGTGEPPFSAADALAWMKRTKAGRPQVFEWQARDRTGRLLYEEVNMRRATIGGHDRLVVTIRDLTERRRSEEKRRRTEDELRTSEARLRAILNTTGAGVAYADQEGNILYSNETFQGLVGYDAAELLGLNIARFTHPAYVETERALLGELAAGKRDRFRLEKQLVTKDGDLRWVDLSVSIIRDDKNRTLYFVGVLIDISERKGVEEALRATSEQLHAVISASPMAVISLDRDENVKLWNPAAERILGWTAEEVLNHPIPYIPPDKTEEAAELHRRWCEGEIVAEAIELERMRKDGSRVQLSFVSAPLHNRSGEFIGDMALLADISERKRAAEALQRAKEQTEAANRELERAIARANQLAVEAQAASAAKSEFVANMSHEIRTPINGVIGMTALLLDTDLSPVQSDYAETVRVSAESLLVIVNDILDFSKIEAGKLEMEDLAFDLRHTLEEMGDLLALRAHQKGLEFTTLVEPEVPSLLCGDPGRLRQVLTNLVGNAVKFTEQGEVAVGVSLDSEDEKTATLHFTVRDTGVGIPEDKLEALFLPFTQADASTTRRFGGTGLGLSISKSLVALMKGEIGAASVPSEGSTFWFTARLEKQAVAADEDDAGFQPALEASFGAGVAGARILAVDDNLTNRKVLAGLLGSWGVRHAEVEGAGPALAALREAAQEGDPYLIAILDMQMPDVDGEALGAMIREDRSLAGTALVMMTSMGSRGDAIRLEQAGFAAYLTKPVKQSQLHDCLLTVLNRDACIKQPQPAHIITRHSLADRAKSRVRILLAEDNFINQRVALATLEKLGYRADAVANGLEALAALGSRSYSLVLMDVQMPEMDGLEATARVRDPRSAVRDHDLPIVALTAAAMKGDRERCLAAGMNDYLTKPLRPEELRGMIERWTAGAAGTVSAAAAPAAAASPAAPSAPPAPASGASIPVFDGEALLHALGGDEELAQEIVAEFLVDVRRQLDVLHEADVPGGTAQLARRAHALKGAAATVRALALEAEAARLEAEAKQAGEERLSHRDERVAALETAFGLFAADWERKGLGVAGR